MAGMAQSPPETPSRGTPRRLLAPLSAVLLVALAACGSGSSSKPAAQAVTASPTTTAPASGGGGWAGGAANRAALQAFRDCMSAQGSPLPTAAPRPPNQNGGTGTGGGAAGANGGGAGGNGAGGGRGGGGGAGRGFGVGFGGVVVASTSSDPKVQAAFAACRDKLPAGYLERAQQQQQQLTAYASCMKDHGVTVATGPRAPGSPSTTVDRTSSAYQICSQLLPTQGRGGGSTNTTTVQ